MLAAAPGGFEWATFAIALVGALSGLGGVAWRIYEWRASGPSVTVKGLGGITSFTPGTSAFVAIIEAVAGRQACQVTGAGFELDDGRGYAILGQLPGSEPLPTTVQPGHEASWLLPLADFAQFVNDYPGEDLHLVAYVLSGGKRVRAKKGYRVAKSVILREAAGGS
jgi:hypothetical protein